MIRKLYDCLLQKVKIIPQKITKNYIEDEMNFLNNSKFSPLVPLEVYRVRSGPQFPSFISFINSIFLLNFIIQSLKSKN